MREKTVQRCRSTIPIVVLVVAIMPALGTVGIAGAEPINFDFEDQATTFDPTMLADEPGALSSLSVTQSGLTMDITRPVGGRFDIVKNVPDTVKDVPASRGLFDPQAKPAAFGLKSLDPFFESEDATSFIVNFSMSVTSVSVDMGDYGEDDDSLSLQAFSGPDGTGTLLDSDSDVLVGDRNQRDDDTAPGGARGLSDFTFLTLTVAAQGINSVRMIGGTPGFANSVFYDNLTVVPAPKPPAAALTPLGVVLLSLGLASLAMSYQRKSREP